MWYVRGKPTVSIAGGAAGPRVWDVLTCAEPAIAVTPSAQTKKRTTAPDGASSLASLTAGSLPHAVGEEDQVAWTRMVLLWLALAPAFVVTFT
jgi:hypothetical protein